MECFRFNLYVINLCLDEDFISLCILFIPKCPYNHLVVHSGVCLSIHVRALMTKFEFVYVYMAVSRRVTHDCFA